MTKAELKQMEKEAFAEMKKLKDEVTTTTLALTLTLTPTLTPALILTLNLTQPDPNPNRLRPLPKKPRSRTPHPLGSSTLERRDSTRDTWAEGPVREPCHPAVCCLRSAEGGSGAPIPPRHTTNKDQQSILTNNPWMYIDSYILFTYKNRFLPYDFNN